MNEKLKSFKQETKLSVDIPQSFKSEPMSKATSHKHSNAKGLKLS